MAQDHCTSLGPEYGLAEIYDEETHELIRNHGTNIGSNFDWWLGAVSADKGQVYDKKVQIFYRYTFVHKAENI